jgi:hypothetical protein
MFGKTFMDAAKPTPPAKNYATAQQKVANSRPIPTYKVGGPVKKADGGKLKPLDGARFREFQKEEKRQAMGRGSQRLKSERSQAEERDSYDGSAAQAYGVADRTAHKLTKRATSGPVKKAMGGEARMFDEAVAAMPSPVMRAVGGAGKTRKGQAPIKRAMGGPVKDGSKKDAEYGDYVAGEKDRKPTKPVKKAMGGVGKMHHDVPMKGVKPHKGIGV